MIRSHASTLYREDYDDEALPLFDIAVEPNRPRRRERRH
jgi:hypothetical protein